MHQIPVNQIPMNKISIKKSLAAVTVAGLLTVGVAGTAFAAPSDPGTATSDTPAGQTQTQTQTQDRATHRGVRRDAIKAAAQAAASTIGVEVAELKAAVKGGQTVGAFAESKGVSADSVVTAVVEVLNGRIDQAVTDGKVDEARAAKVKERVPEFAQRLVNTVPKRFQTSG
jgi:hypothetical protein